MKREIFNIIIGTAGHIDHGKSSLVKILTGIDPDRLKEEKERGLTIDLGFAPLDLPNGKRVGIIDVPGHEKFIKNMVAGATGIDFVMLVIAADDSVMPQTYEHLEIMELLGIKYGLTVITKIDLVEPELLEIAKEEIKDFLKGTFLENSPIIPVSNITLEGIENLKDNLFKLLEKIPPRDTSGIFRMPIQRVFSKHGYGTVITGIPMSGTIKKEDKIEIIPGNYKGSIRNIQAYGEEVEIGRAGHSTALNVRDIDYKLIERGQCVVEPEYFKAVNMIAGKIKYLKQFKKPLEHMTPIKFYVGTAEEEGRIAILGQEKIMPGEEGYVQIRLENPVLTIPGDRFIIRLSSPMMTLGGGIVLSIESRKLKRFKEEVINKLKEREKALKDKYEKVNISLKLDTQYPCKEEDIPKVTYLTLKELKPIIEKLCKENKLEKIEVGALKYYIHQENLKKWKNKIIEVFEEYYKSFPFKIYLETNKILERLKEKNLYLEQFFLDYIIKVLEKEKIIALDDTKKKIKLYNRKVKLTLKQQKILKEIEEIYLKRLFTPPSFKEVLNILNISEELCKNLIEYLVEINILVYVNKEILFHKKAIEQAKDLIIEIIQTQGELITADFKEKLGTTRKYIIPLLDYFDNIGLTIRSDNKRILKGEKK